MAIMKDGDNSVSVKEIRKTIDELFEEGRYVDMFQKAGFKNTNSKDKKDALSSFYELIDENVIEAMVEEKTIEDFLNGLNHFLDSRSFSYNEKAAFFNNCEEECIMEALNANQIELARKINNHRKDKDFSYFDNYISDLAENDDVQKLQEIINMSTSVSENNSEILRQLYNNNLRNYDFFCKLIQEHNLDINAVGGISGMTGEGCFTHMVACYQGTIETQIFHKFIKDFKNQINFDSLCTSAEFKRKFNFFESLFNSSLSSLEKLDRLFAVIENCNVSIKHLAYIATTLVQNNEYYARHYDHKIYETIFKHENFNSDLFDRESILIKILNNDNSDAIKKARRTNGNTVNPTSVVLQKLFNLSQPIIRKHDHPFILWLGKANDNFSKDTLKNLVDYYGDSLLSLDLRKIDVDNSMKKALEEMGLSYPKPLGWRVAWGRDNDAKKMCLTRIGQESVKKEVIIEDKKEIKLVINNSFAIALLEQVKDEEVKKLIESVNFNYQQYQSLNSNRLINDDVHYMTELLPKFLKTTIDNYLHYSMLDSDYAKQEALVQLKLLNRKAFSILKAELDREESNIKYQSAIHSTVLQKYE